MDIERAIIKHLINEADSSDLDALSAWIENPENGPLFENYVKIYYEITLAMSNPDIRHIKRKVLQKIREDKSRYRGYRIYPAGAAKVIHLLRSGAPCKEDAADNEP